MFTSCGDAVTWWTRTAVWPAIILAGMWSTAADSAFADEASELPRITPAQLDAPRQSIKLNSECVDIVAGGGGRYLILSMPGAGKLAVLDASAAKIVKEIPVASADIDMAAGADCLIVALRDKKLLQRWNLTDFQREATATFPPDIDVRAIAMGCASRGPVGVIASRLPHPRIGFLDPETLKLSDYKIVRPKDTSIDAPDRVEMRASAGGDVFAFNPLNVGSNGDVLIARLDGQTATFRLGETKSLLYAAPSHHGRRVYVGPSVLGWYGNALISPADGMACAAVHESRTSTVLLPPWKTPPSVFWSALVPAIGDDWYLALPDANRPRDRPDQADEEAAEQTGGALLFHASDTRPVAALPDVDLEFTSDDFTIDRQKPRPALDERAWLIPQAKLLVVLARSNRELILHHVDVEQLGRDSKFDFLVIAGDPPATVKPGEKLRYAMRVLSKQGGVKYHLLQSPDGMRIDAQGQLIWDVPEHAPPASTDVIVSVTDATGREAFQSFSLAVEAPPERAVTEPHGDALAPSNAEIARNHPPAAMSADAPLPPINPPPLAEDELAVELDDAIADIVPGGAGRYLVLYFRHRREVAVFDVSQAKIIYTIPVQDAQIHLAAGLEKLVVVLAEQRLALRYELATGRREQVVRLAGEEPIMKAVMGSASRGPLITGHFSFWLDYEGAVLYDLETLRPLPTAGGGGELFGADHHLRAFRDGTMFGSATSHEDRRGVWVRVGSKLFELPRNWKPGQPPPDLDDDPVSPAGAVFHRQIYGERYLTFRPKWTALAERGDYYLTFDYAPRSGIQKLRVNLIGESQPLVDLTGVSVPNSPVRLQDVRLIPTARPGTRPTDWGTWEWLAGERLPPPDRRVHLIPDAKVLVTVPLPADRLMLHRVDVNELVKHSPVDYLVVRSAPPRAAARGTLFRYPVEVLSKRGGVKYAVDLGPDGMTVSPAGEVLWRVPLDADEQQHQVVLSVRDAGGQERLQTFTLQLVAAATDSPSAVDPAPAAAKLRLWIDSTGKNRVRAVFLELLPDDKVRLKKENGAVIVVPLAKLSDVDQKYVRQRGEQHND